SPSSRPRAPSLAWSRPSPIASTAIPPPPLHPGPRPPPALTPRTTQSSHALHAAARRHGRVVRPPRHLRPRLYQRPLLVPRARATTLRLAARPPTLAAAPKQTPAARAACA